MVEFLSQMVAYSEIMFVVVVAVLVLYADIEELPNISAGRPELYDDPLDNEELPASELKLPPAPLLSEVPPSKH